MLAAMSAPTACTAAPAAVIFDNDGLLLDTEQTWTRAERTLFLRRGRDFTEHHKRALLGASSADASRLLEGMLDEEGAGGELIDELHQLVMEEAERGADPRPGALSLIGRLRADGVPLGLASNSPRAFVERTLGAAGLLDGAFEAIVSAEEVERGKPFPDVYLEACARIGAQPGECVALEDSPTGVSAAVAAGLRVIGVPYLRGDDLRDAHLVAGSLDDPVVAAALGLLRAAL